MTQKDAEEKAAGFVIYKKSMLACALKLVHNRQVASALRLDDDDDDDVLMAVPFETGGAQRSEKCSARVLDYDATPLFPYRKPVFETTLRPLGGLCL